jgi:hypothetical protein
VWAVFSPQLKTRLHFDEARWRTSRPAVLVTSHAVGNADSPAQRGDRDLRDAFHGVEPVVEGHAGEHLAAPAPRPVAKAERNHLRRQAGAGPRLLIEAAMEGDEIGGVALRHGFIEPSQKTLVGIEHPPQGHP